MLFIKIHMVKDVTIKNIVTPSVGGENFQKYIYLYFNITS